MLPWAACGAALEPAPRLPNGNGSWAKRVVALNPMNHFCLDL